MRIERTLLIEIAKYNKLGNDSTDINQIVNYRKTITMLSFYFSKRVGDLRREFLMSEAKRQTDIAMLRLENNIPEWKAELNAKPSKLDLAKKESDYRTADYIMKSTHKVLDEINQRVAYLRQEFDKSKSNM